jgi:hypothetical protein
LKLKRHKAQGNDKTKIAQNTDQAFSNDALFALEHLAVLKLDDAIVRNKEKITLEIYYAYH